MPEKMMIFMMKREKKRSRRFSRKIRGELYKKPSN